MYYASSKDGFRWTQKRIELFENRVHTTVLSQEELENWLENELSFSKPIVHPTTVNRHNDPTESYQNPPPLFSDISKNFSAFFVTKPGLKKQYRYSSGRDD